MTRKKCENAKIMSLLNSQSPVIDADVVILLTELKRPIKAGLFREVDLISLRIFSGDCYRRANDTYFPLQSFLGLLGHFVYLG